MELDGQCTSGWSLLRLYHCPLGEFKVECDSGAYCATSSRPMSSACHSINRCSSCVSFLQLTGVLVAKLDPDLHLGVGSCSCAIAPESANSKAVMKSTSAVGLTGLLVVLMEVWARLYVSTTPYS